MHLARRDGAGCVVLGRFTIDVIDRLRPMPGHSFFAVGKHFGNSSVRELGSQKSGLDSRVIEGELTSQGNELGNSF